MQILRALTFLMLTLCLLAASPVLSADILIVQGMHDKSFDEAVKGFRSKCGASSTTITLSDYSDVDVARIVREEQPSLILTLGESALASVRKVQTTPVLSLMSLALSMGRPAPANVTGIGMVASPAEYVQLFAGMNVKRVGVLYNPSHSGAYLARARQAAQQAGIKLIAHEVRDPREIPAKLALLKGQVDALWLIPDTTTITLATIDAYFLFSLEQWKPVVAFAEHYLSLGASVVLDNDHLAVGRQAGVAANRLLKGASPRDIAIQNPVVVLKQNKAVVKKLGLPSLHEGLFSLQ